MPYNYALDGNNSTTTTLLTTTTTTTTTYYYCFMALCPGLPRWASTRRNIHPLTYPDH